MTTVAKKHMGNRYRAFVVCVTAILLALSGALITFMPTPARATASNIAQGKTAVASSEEANSVRAANAVDGDTTSSTSRWGSGTGSGPQWIYVDLGSVQPIAQVRVFWESGKATSYKIQLASTDTAPAPDSPDWRDAKVFDSHPAAINDVITLDEVQNARFVRLYIEGVSESDPLSVVVDWPTISIYELEVYSEVPDPAVPTTLATMAEAIEVSPIQADDTQASWSAPTSERFTVEYKGTDLEQVIGSDLTIYSPLVDKTVKMAFKVSENGTNNYVLKEVAVNVPGVYTAETGDNPAPVILPELQEWKGGTGVFTPTDASRVIYTDASLAAAAQALADDYRALTGHTLQVQQGTAGADGDITLQLTTDESAGLDDEGYLMEVGDSIAVTAESATGAYWATRTILQSIKQTGNVPQGIARDYPTYKVRGFILDVGRKTFKLSYLKEIVQQMAWYKLNDFHVHLNDNYIWLENLDNPMEAYSAFRLESDVKAGGNGGLNKADLTAKDVWYSKADFRDFIEESRTFGVNIVPEFDVPAHSLAFTKVRPDLRTGTNGRQNDHLDLRNQYDSVTSFIKGIFNEYITGADPVFDSQTTVHIGADEYEADREAYRRFADDMLRFIKDSGRTPRIWGSLTTLRGTTPVHSDGVQMNIWNSGWANPKQMYDEGYDLINSLDGQYYIVPNAGYYYSNGLQDGTLYNSPINNMAGTVIPAGDPQMLGGAFAVWNDMTYDRENGVSEYDVYTLTKNAIPLMGAKLWGKGSQDLAAANATRASLADAPRTNFTYAVDHEGDAIAHYTMESLSDLSANGNDLPAAATAAITQVDGDAALHIEGGSSCVPTGLPTVGLGNDLRVKVKRTDASVRDQILFSSDYGQIKAVQAATGKVGFSRENHDYSFDYELPVNTWVELEFKNTDKQISLYVDGELVETLGDDETVEGRPLWASNMFPLSCVGSATGDAFSGYVDDIRVGRADTFFSTMELDRAVEVLSSIDPQSPAIVQAYEVISQYDPSEQSIAQALEAVRAAIDAQEYERADYSRVDALIAATPEDLSGYTDDSVARLRRAMALVRRDLPKAMQGTVDDVERAIADARSALVIDTSAADNYLQCAQLTATASSQETGQENNAATNAVDCQTGTIWHSNWGQQAPEYSLTLQINDGAANVKGLEYTPRSGGGNGNVTGYRIETSLDGRTFTEVANGTWADDAQVKTAAFPATQAQYVRLVVTAGKAGFASAAEVRLLVLPADPDRAQLQDLADQASELDEALYTDDSWAPFARALAAMCDALADPDSQAQVLREAKDALIDAERLLVLRDRPAPDPGTDPGTDPDPGANPDPEQPGTEQPEQPGTEQPGTDPEQPGSGTDQPGSGTEQPGTGGAGSSTDPGAGNPTVVLDPELGKEATIPSLNRVQIADTGSNALWAAVASIALLAGGAVFLNRRKRDGV